jgi:hypothetical protein
MKSILVSVCLLFSLAAAAQTLVITDQKNKIYSGLTLSNIIMLRDTNVVIIHCKIKNSKEVGITVGNCGDVAIVHDTLINLQSGVIATVCDNIKVNNNYILNVSGDANHDIQFDECTGGEIRNNHLQNDHGMSSVSDVINLYKSNGTKNAPIMVSGNWIVGGGPSTSGSGIMLADSGGSWQIAIGNILVNPGQVGIGVAGGNHIKVSHNVVYGARQTFTNLGIYAWNQSTSPSNNIEVSYNLVNFTDHNGRQNNYWDGGNCGKINWDTNKCNSGLNATILPDKL